MIAERIGKSIGIETIDRIATSRDKGASLSHCQGTLQEIPADSKTYRKVNAK